MPDLRYIFLVVLAIVAIMGLPYAAAWWLGRNDTGPRGRGLVQPDDGSYEVRG